MLKIEPVSVPIQMSDKEWRVAGTQVPIDTVIFAFNHGDSPQEIVEQYPALKLADVYAVIAYYLQARAEVDAYLEERRERATYIRREVEKVGGDLRKLPPEVFGTAVRSINWEEKSPEESLAAIRIAFEREAGLLARELAQRGHEQYPDHEELEKAARILAPPKVIKTNRKANPTLAQTMQWFRDHKGEYKGHWVAVNAGRLVGVQRTRQQLIDSLGEYQDDPSTLVTKL